MSPQHRELAGRLTSAVGAIRVDVLNDRFATRYVGMRLTVRPPLWRGLVETHGLCQSHRWSFFPTRTTPEAHNARALAAFSN
jgi:hypothetical protein